MDISIQPLTREQIPELRDFLTSGFNEPADAEFASASVLEWKYFDPTGFDLSSRAFVGTVNGRIISCVGLCPTWWFVGDPGQRVSAAHGIDWLASRDEVSAGLMVYQRGEEATDVHFVIGGTAQATAIKRKLGYGFPLEVPTYCRILRPMHRLRRPRQTALWKAVLKVARDYARLVLHVRRPPSLGLELRQVSVFGVEVERIFKECRMRDIHSVRTPELLNHYLRYPAKNITGWLIMERDQVRGYALLSLTRQQNILAGKIVDCFMDSPDTELWKVAIFELTSQLGKSSPDFVSCYGSTQWMASALTDNGYSLLKTSPFSLRDPKGLIPAGSSFYLTMLEADHGY